MSLDFRVCVEPVKRSLRYAPPHFLSRSVASIESLRLSLRRAASVVVVSAAK
jgi:hypothetical protein